MKNYRRRAFTIVELLIVVAIIGLLVSLALAGLSGVQKRSRKTDELNNLRQVGLAWSMYGTGNNDAALPGYLEPEVQQRWKVVYNYPNQADIPPAPTYGAADPNIAGPWVWRLLPLLNNVHDMVHGYDDLHDDDPFTMIAEAEEIALEPSFGYNGYYVGGYWQVVNVPPDNPGDPPILTARPRFGTALDANGRQVTIPTVISQLRRSSELLIFCSSMTAAPGVYRKMDAITAGGHLAVPTVLADEPQWNTYQNDQYSVEAFTDTFPPLGRHTGAAVVLFGDGHTDMRAPGAMRDQRLWINGADSATYTHDPN